MDRSRAVAAVVVVLGALALVTAASALDGAQTRTEGESDAGFGIGEGTGSGIGSGNGTGIQINSSAAGGGGGGGLLRTVLDGVVVLVVVLGVLTPIAVLLAGGLSALRRFLRDVLLAGLAIGIVVVFVLALLLLAQGLIGDGGGGLLGGGSTPANGGGSSDQSSASGTLPVPPLVVGGAIALAVLALLVARIVGRRLDGSATPDEAATGDDGQSVAVDGGTQPRAADAAATNDVYIAWRALASATPNVDRTATPKEVAAAAVRDGRDEQAVRDLTRQFRAVRYGGARPTEDRERDARAALDAADVRPPAALRKA